MNNLPQRTNAYAPWNPSPANNYVYTYSAPATQQQTTMTVFTVGDRKYGVPSNMIFTCTVSQTNKK